MVIKKVNRLRFVHFKSGAHWFWYLLQLFASFLSFFVCNSEIHTGSIRPPYFHKKHGACGVLVNYIWYDTERLDLINMSTNADCQSVQCKVALACSKLHNMKSLPVWAAETKTVFLYWHAGVGGWWALWVEGCWLEQQTAKGAPTSAQSTEALTVRI